MEKSFAVKGNGLATEITRRPRLQTRGARLPTKSFRLVTQLKRFKLLQKRCRCATELSLRRRFGHAK